jgi:hypothetical protein
MSEDFINISVRTYVRVLCVCLLTGRVEIFILEYNTTFHPVIYHDSICDDPVEAQLFDMFQTPGECGGCSGVCVCVCVCVYVKTFRGHTETICIFSTDEYNAYCVHTYSEDMMYWYAVACVVTTISTDS